MQNFVFYPEQNVCECIWQFLFRVNFQTILIETSETDFCLFPTQIPFQSDFIDGKWEKIVNKILTQSEYINKRQMLF